jgi:hypothetical protein
LPIREIAEIAELVVKRDSIQQLVDASPIRERAHRLGRTVSDTRNVINGIEWIRAVRQSDPPRELLSKLTSTNAAQERLHLRTTAKRGKDLLDRMANGWRDKLEMLCRSGSAESSREQSSDTSWAKTALQ